VAVEIVQNVPSVQSSVHLFALPGKESSLRTGRWGATWCNDSNAEQRTRESTSRQSLKT
jgi:hypothetical protein